MKSKLILRRSYWVPFWRWVLPKTSEDLYVGFMISLLTIIGVAIFRYNLDSELAAIYLRDFDKNYLMSFAYILLVVILLYSIIYSLVKTISKSRDEQALRKQILDSMPFYAWILTVVGLASFSFAQQPEESGGAYGAFLALAQILYMVRGTVMVLAFRLDLHKNNAAFREAMIENYSHQEMVPFHAFYIVGLSAVCSGLSIYLYGNVAFQILTAHLLLEIALSFKRFVFKT